MAHVEPVVVGRMRIETICEGFAALALAEESASLGADWAAERERRPWAFHDEVSWAWHVHAFVLRTPEGCVLVDTGVGGFGPYKPWVESYAGAWSRVDPEEVGHVVLTHLHADHAGGTVGPDGSPRFPNAVYHLHPADWEHFTRDPDPDLYDARIAMEPIQVGGMLDLHADDHEVAPGIHVLHSPGHTPGHRSVLLRDGDETLLLTGDLLHLPIQADHPELPSSHDEDPELGAASRRVLLEQAARGTWEVAVPHFARPFGHVGPAGWVET
jgi:glyoxylase-like metal-dependent hydrolase (beta-lactamase superfamily II)